MRRDDIRLTISTDSPEKMEEVKRYITAGYKTLKVKGPTVTDKGRLNYYIFLGEKRQTVNNPR